MNLSDLLADRASAYPDKTFLLFECQPDAATSEQVALPSFRQSLTFAELDERVNQACHLLARLGLARGDVRLDSGSSLVLPCQHTSIMRRSLYMTN